MQLNCRHPNANPGFVSFVPFGADNLERNHRFGATLPPLSFCETPLAQSLEKGNCCCKQEYWPKMPDSA